MHSGGNTSVAFKFNVKYFLFQEGKKIYEKNHIHH